MQLAEMKLVRFVRECIKADEIRNEIIRLVLDIFLINYKLNGIHLNEKLIDGMVQNRCQRR